jgi:hypothetical protein
MEEALSYMTQKIGQQIYGKNLINLYNEIFQKFKDTLIETAVFQILKMYVESNNTFFNIAKKDQQCIEILLENTKDLKKIALVGCVFPIEYLIKIKEKYPDVEFTLIDKGYFLYLMKDYLKEKYNATLISLNPLFDDISEHIDNVDLIIYPETELLVPFEMLKYKNKKLMFVINYFWIDHKLNINQAFNEDDLVDLCGVEDVIVKGMVEMNTNRSAKKAYYVLGKQNDC